MVRRMKYHIRSMFIPEKGNVFLAFDLSQAESWVVAHMADETNMKYALKHGDIHSQTACVLFGLTLTDANLQLMKEDKVKRYAGKQNNHAQSYRMGPFRLAEVFNKRSDKPPYLIITIDEAKRMSKAWHSFYHLKGWWNEIEEDLRVNNRTLITPYGRVRTFFERWGDELFKAATAHLPQSTVADHAYGKVQTELGIAGGILEMNRWCKKNKIAKIVHSAHDSAMFEMPANEVDNIAPIMYGLFHRPMVIKGEEFQIPVDCEIGTRWGPEMSKYAIKL